MSATTIHEDITSPEASHQTSQPKSESLQAGPSEPAEKLNAPYLRIIYPENGDTQSEFSVDIIAVHGLAEDPESTWKKIARRTSSGLQAKKGNRGRINELKDDQSKTKTKNPQQQQVPIQEARHVYGHSQEGLVNRSSMEEAPELSSKPFEFKAGPDGNSRNVTMRFASSSSHTLPQSSPISPTKSRSPNGRIYEPNWLKDEIFLPTSIPNARVMQFEYQTALHGPKGDQMSLSELGNALLYCVDEKRTAENLSQNRPIVFIGHCYGGIIIAQALASLNNTTGAESTPANGSAGNNKNIISSTAGVVFLGTPFGGLDMSRIRQALQATRNSLIRVKSDEFGASSSNLQLSLSRSCPIQSNAPVKLGKVVENSHGNKTLETRKYTKLLVSKDQVEAFIKSLNNREISWVSFHGNPKDSRAGKENKPGEGSIVLEAPHSDISKFSKPEDNDYRIVIGRIKKMIADKHGKLLMDSVNTDNLKTSRFWLDSGAGVDYKDEFGRTALHIAVEKCNKLLVQELLGRKANPSEKDKDGKGPLFFAVDKGDGSIVEMLLKHGADVSQRASTDGQTALHISTIKRSCEITKLLLDKGADPKAENDSGSSPLKSVEQVERKNTIDAELLNLLKSKLLVEGPSLKKQERGASKNPGKPEGIRKDACEAFKATVMAFFEIESREYRLIETPSVYELLYGLGPHRILDTARSKGDVKKKPSFKWFHLPANNLVWVQALLTRAGFESSCSTWTQHHHRGHTPHGRFLRPHYKRKEQSRCIPIFPCLKGLQRVATAGPKIGSSISPTAKRPKTAATMLEIGSSPKPTCASTPKRPREASISDKNLAELEKVRKYETEITLAIPYLGFEEHENHKKMSNFIKDCKKIPENEPASGINSQEKLIRGYLHHDPPLHPRRSLDQFYYSMLKDTQKRDEDQVIYRYAKKYYSSDSTKKKIIMVDQLWIWIVGDVIITSFPHGWLGKIHEEAEFDLLEIVKKCLNSQDRNPMTKPHHLAMEIMKLSWNVFESSWVKDLNALDFFDDSISKVSHQEAKHFATFTKSSRKLRDLWDIEGYESCSEDEKDYESDSDVEKAQSVTDNKENPGFIRWAEMKLQQKIAKEQLARSNYVKSIFDVTKEMKLFTEIKDIRDELNIITMVMQDHLSVMKSIAAELEKSSPEEDATEINDIDEYSYAKYLQNEVEIRIREIEKMDKRAKETYEALNHLLDLKQKQASVLEARFARNQAEDTAKQGKTIMVFTIVTIVFLPLSFMATFFTLDVEQFPKDKTGNKSLQLQYVSKYIFGISMAVSIPFILVAMKVNFLQNLFKKASKKSVKGVLRVREKAREEKDKAKDHQSRYRLLSPHELISQSTKLFLTPGNSSWWDRENDDVNDDASKIV